MGARVAIVIGSGFGGSVVALRLAEAAETFPGGPLRVIVLERGRRYGSGDFPRLGLPGEWTANPELQTSKPLPDVARFSWQNDLGLWELRNLRGLQVAQAAGLGGGSLIYAAVHLRAPDSVFREWPAGYNDRELDAYYRKVEDTLGLQIAPPERWAKTTGMQRVARQLGREQDFFRPPLAINFRESDAAPACSGCGHCTIGCPTGAKNTLDRNYLAEAERRGAELRTLCEAVEIEALDSGGYRVAYRDHAFGGALREELATYVFVCAGALNSTELLMRSRRALLAPRHTDSAGREHALEALGAPFFANGDALGVVFDADRPWLPTEGPTITSSLYVGPPRPANANDAPATGGSPAPTERDDGAPPSPDDARSASDGGDSWFLIQDGGMPWSLARALNLLRSPLWLGRNQIVGRGIEAEHSAPYTAQMRARGDFLAGLPGMLYRDDPRHDPRGGADHRSVSPEDPASSLLLDILPEPARESAETLLGFKSLVERHLSRVVDRVVARVDGERPGLGFFRWLARLDRDRLTELTKQVLEATYPAARVVLQSRNAGEVLVALARNASRLDAPLENTLVLLAMGADEALELKEAERPDRDSAEVPVQRDTDDFFADRDARTTRDDRELNCRSAGRGPQPPLRLEVVPARDRADVARRQRIYRQQERLMSDIAQATGGELRTNPSWTIGRQPVTVHAQGGCAMGRVTDSDGQVIGFENLYVMDGAAFPSSVGVNPSHTIAAVAERNIARFIARAHARREEDAARAATEASPRRTTEASPREATEASPREATEASPREANRVVEIERATHRRPAIRTGPTELVWRERLKGFFVARPPYSHASAPASGGRRGSDDPFAVTAGANVFHECERQGALLGQGMELEVQATVPDLDAMIDGRNPMVHLSNGRFSVDDGSGRAGRVAYDVSGELELQLGGTGVAPLTRHREARPSTGGMVYRMRGPGEVRLYGFKQLTDDPGIDAWLDLTTLYVDVNVPGRLLRGVLRVSIPDFLREQLPSFSIRKAGLAPEQQLWGLGQFARFFLGRVGRIYMPEWL